MSFARQWRLLVCAAQFLTRLPIPRLTSFEPDWISRSARYFPLVGQLVGVLAAIVWLAAGKLWPGLPAAVLAVGASLLVTGAFHEDGLADTADGLGGGDRERRLAIMKDSRLGSFGVLALIVVLGARITLLASLSPETGALALIAANGGGRAAAVLVMAVLPYGGDASAAKIKPAPQGVRWSEAGFALVTGVWPLVWFGVPRASLAIGLAVATTLSMAILARKLIGGMTGDVLGAAEQLAEVALLMGAAARLGG